MPDLAVRTQEKERLFDLLIYDLRSPLAIASTSVHNLIRRASGTGRSPTGSSRFWSASPAISSNRKTCCRR